MKTYVNRLPLIVIMALLITSCKYHCDGYDTSRRESMPFRVGDSIRYESNKHDTIVLYINDFYAEGSSSYTSMPIMDYTCPKEAYYTTTTDEKFGICIKEVHGQDMNKRIAIFCDNDTYDFYEKNREFESTYFESLEIAETMYEHVTSVKDTSGKRRISSYDEALFYGVIRFYDSETGLTWMQIIDEKKD